MPFDHGCGNMEFVIIHIFFECRVTAVDGHYQIGIYTVRGIQHGEEITFDYNSVTEVCLQPVRLGYPTELIFDVFVSKG